MCSFGDVGFSVTTPYEYWTQRYEMRQGSSVYKDIDAHRARVWEIIEETTGGLHDRSVTDVGCGDMGFWRGHNLPRNYTGVDWVRSIVEKNASRWPHGRWCLQDATDVPVPPAQVVLMIDVLFHIMDDWRAELLLDQAAAAAHRWLFVVGHHEDPFAGMNERQVARIGRYLRYRRIPTQIPNFVLVRCEITSGPVALSVFRRTRNEPT